MFGQVCTCHDIAYAISVLGKFQSNREIVLWEVAKKGDEISETN